MRRSNPRTAMLHWFVCDGKLSKIVANHFRLRVCSYTEEVIEMRKENGKGEKEVVRGY